MSQTALAIQEDLTVKDHIINLLGMVKREGMDILIGWLLSSDYFEAPSSMKNHGAHTGGLATHSYNVYLLLGQKVKIFGLDIPEESVIICSLLHDLCKVNFYKEGGKECSDAQYNFLQGLYEKRITWGNPVNKAFESKFVSEGSVKRDIPGEVATVLIDWLKNKPNEKMPELPLSWSIEDQFPMGHGEKSVSIIQDFIKLTLEEKLAIRWHMGPWEVGTMLDYQAKNSFNKAKEMFPLVTLLQTADFEASSILERGNE